MFRRDNSSKYVSRRSMEGGSPSSRKSKRDGTRESMDEDIWGEDLDDDSLDRCFIMASQAISQQETKETSSMELPGTNIQAKAPTEWSMEQFDEPRAPAPRAHLFTPKRPSTFLSNVSFAASKTDGKEQIHFLPRNFSSGGQSQFPPRNVEAPKKPQSLAGQTQRQFPTSAHTANVVPTKQIGVMPRNVGVSAFPSSRSRQMGTLPFVKKSVDAGPRNIPSGAKHVLPGNEVSSSKQPEAVPYILPTQTFPRSDRLLQIGTVPRSAPPVFSEAQIFPKCYVPFKQKDCVSISSTLKQTQIFPKGSTSKQQEPELSAFPSSSRQTHSFPKSDDVSKQRDFIPQNVISTSRSVQISKSGPMSSKHVESLPKSVNASTIPRSVHKLDTVPSSKSSSVVPATGEVTKKMPEDIGLSTTSATTSTSVLEDLRKQVENLKCVNQALQDNVLTKEGEVKILRSQMKSLKTEVDSQREMKKLEEESELERYRNRVKQLEQELEKKSSLLEFKSMEADNAEERCRLLQSCKLKLVSPQPSQTPSRPSPAHPRISPKPSPVEHQSGHPPKKYLDSRLISPLKTKSCRQETEKCVKLPVKSAASTVQLLIRQEVEKSAEFLVKHNSAFNKEVLQRHLERRNGIGVSDDDAAKQQQFEKHFGLPLSTFANNRPGMLQSEKCLSANKSRDGTPSPKCVSSPSKVQQMLLPAKSSSSASQGRNNPLTLKSFPSSSKMECVPLSAMSAVSSSKRRVERMSLLRKSIFSASKSLKWQKDENKLPFFSKNKISDGSYFRRLISPYIFEPPMGGAERESYLGLLQVPIMIEGDVANLTPYGMTVNVNHAAVVELTRMHSLHDTDAQYLINKIVWQCYLMLVEQESLLRRYSIPTKEEMVMKLDYKISMQAGKLVESNDSVLSSRSWFTLEQGVEIRRALGLLAALALASDYAAEYMAGIIRCNKYVTDVTLPKKCFYKPKPKSKPKPDPVEEWSPPVKDDCEIELSQEEQLELSEIRHKCQELRKPWIREREERCEQEKLVAEQEHALILSRIREIEEAHPHENKNEICNVELWYLRNRARCLGILNDEVQERCSRKSNIQQVATSKCGSAEKILKSVKNIAVPKKATFQEPIAGPSNKHDVPDVSSRTISTINKAKKDSSVQKLSSKRVKINEPAKEIDVIIISDSNDEKSDTATSKVNEYFKIGKNRQTNNKKLDTKKHKVGKHLADAKVPQVSDEISDLEDKQSNSQENKIGDRDIIEDRNKKSKSVKRKVKERDGKEESHLKKRKTDENEISESALKKSKIKEGDSGRPSLMGNKSDNSVMNQAGSENGPQTSNRKPSAGETRSRTSSSKLDSETDHLKQSEVVEIAQLNVGKSGVKTTKIKQTTIVNDPNLFKDDVKSDQKGIGVKHTRIMMGRQFGSKTVGSLQQGVKNNSSVSKEKKVEPSKNVNSDDKLFKKPYPVTWPRTVVKSTGVRTIVRRQLPCEDNDTKAFTVRNMRIMKRRRQQYRHLKGRNPMRHPVVRACQKEAQKVIEKRLDKKDGTLKNKLDVPSPHTRTKKKADLLKLLYRIVRHICDKRLTLTFNGILFGVVHLLKAIASRVIFSKDRWPLLQDTVRDVILCRPSVRVIVELMDLLTNLAFYPSIMESLCRDTGPCPYVGGNFGLVFFYDGVPRYDLGYDVGEEKYNRHSCMLNLLCYLVAVQRASIRQYVKLGVNMLTWLNYVYTLNNNTGPYWIGPNDNNKQKIRNCQCRPRIIEAFIWLMYLCYRHLEKTGYEKDTLFFEVRHFLANGLQFVLMMIQSDPEVGLYMANVEGEYRDLLMGLSHSLKDIGFTKSDEHTLLLLKVLEDDQDAEHSVKTCSNISKEYLSELCTTVNTIISTLFYRFTHSSNQASQIAGSSKDHQ